MQLPEDFWTLYFELTNSHLLQTINDTFTQQWRHCDEILVTFLQIVTEVVY